jgi:hypothetical protein
MGPNNYLRDSLGREPASLICPFCQNQVSYEVEINLNVVFGFLPYT